MGLGDFTQFSILFNPGLIELSPSDSEQRVHGAPVLVYFSSVKEAKGLIRNIINGQIEKEITLTNGSLLIF